MELKVIPNGPYCYTWEGDEQKVCPYWSMDETKPEQENGFCSFLGWGDWEAEGFTLLWDQVKECGINNNEVE